MLLVQRNLGDQAGGRSLQAAAGMIGMRAVVKRWAKGWQTNLGMVEAVRIAGLGKAESMTVSAEIRQGAYLHWSQSGGLPLPQH